MEREEISAFFSQHGEELQDGARHGGETWDRDSPKEKLGTMAVDSNMSVQSEAVGQPKSRQIPSLRQTSTTKCRTSFNEPTRRITCPAYQASSSETSAKGQYPERRSVTPPSVRRALLETGVFNKPDEMQDLVIDPGAKRGYCKNSKRAEPESRGGEHDISQVNARPVQYRDHGVMVSDGLPAKEMSPAFEPEKAFSTAEKNTKEMHSQDLAPTLSHTSPQEPVLKGQSSGVDHSREVTGNEPLVCQTKTTEDYANIDDHAAPPQPPARPISPKSRLVERLENYAENIPSLLASYRDAQAEVSSDISVAWPIRDVTAGYYQRHLVRSTNSDNLTPFFDEELAQRGPTRSSQRLFAHHGHRSHTERRQAIPGSSWQAGYHAGSVGGIYEPPEHIPLPLHTNNLSSRIEDSYQLATSLEASPFHDTNIADYIRKIEEEVLEREPSTGGVGRQGYSHEDLSYNAECATPALPDRVQNASEYDRIARGCYNTPLPEWQDQGHARAIAPRLPGAPEIVPSESGANCAGELSNAIFWRPDHYLI